MKTFSSWRGDTNHINEKPPERQEIINENNDGIETLKQRLNFDYLRHALGIPENVKKDEPQPESKPVINETLQTKIENLEKTLAIKKQKIVESLEEELPKHENVSEEVEANPDLYKLYRDREESFECNVSVEGATLASAQVRLIVDTSIVNLVFYGKLYKDGRCIVPLKKMTLIPEGTRGQIRLEVIVDDTMFVPWESNCVIEGAKKVSVDIKQKKNVSIVFDETNK